MVEEQIVPTVRNLEPAGEFQPLREFKGVLEKIESSHDEEYNTTHMHLHFTDVDVIESEEPYDFPIASIRFPYNLKVGTRWGIFSNTVTSFLEDNQDISDLVGCNLHMKMGIHKLWHGRERKRTDQLAWELIGVEGTPIPGTVKEESNAMNRALEILDGKTIQKFNSESLKDPIIRGDPEVSKAITDKVFAETMLAEGVVIIDEEGIHHLAQVELDEEPS